MPDPLFAGPALAVLYDVVDDDRSDLDVYEAIIDELGAAEILDVGCGTGTLACRLAATGKRIIALDPAEASLDIARTKPGAEGVRWIHGEVTSLPRLEVDLAIMTGNVAMVFLGDDEWSQVLASLHGAIRTGGWLTFETRNPDRRAWERWTKADTYRSIDTAPAGESAPGST
jgi:2-polyprenyl-3-methyl-5-hydroxy-6-metoxy-1,4-benzoquinol methylase